MAVKVIETFGGRIGPWDEARYLRQLSDPHILPIRNALEDLGQPLLITEIAEGGTVGDRLEESEGLPTLQALDCVRQACLGTARAHREGLIHNDIKPKNLFLTKTNRCMVGDFGFAALADPATGEALMLGGTPTTAAPEALTAALTGRPGATVASDVYSLGATLYWLLSGQPPVPDSYSHEQARDFVTDGKVVPLKKVAPHIGDYGCRVVTKALSVDPSKRHQSAISLHSELTAARVAQATRRDCWRIATHPDHEQCWHCSSHGAKKALTVCLVATGGSNLEIRVTYAGSKRRFAAPKSTSTAKKGRDLRRVFKGL